MTNPSLGQVRVKQHDNGLMRSIAQAILSVAARPPELRGPWLFDEETLQAQAVIARKFLAEAAVSDPSPAELKEEGVQDEDDDDCSCGGGDISGHASGCPYAAASPSKPGEGVADQYLIRKSGAWYRPNSAGYTNNIAEAGRYTLAEAEAITHPNGPDGPRDNMSYEPAPPSPSVDEVAVTLSTFRNWRETWSASKQERKLFDAIEASLVSPPKAGEGEHPDDAAVDRFAAAMKAKLAQKRNEGRGGWERKDECSNEFLSRLLRGHIDKRDPVDVANFAMMIHQRGEIIASAPEPGKPVAWQWSEAKAAAQLDYETRIRKSLLPPLGDGTLVYHATVPGETQPDLPSTAEAQGPLGDGRAEIVEALKPFAALYTESMRDFPDGTAKDERPDDKHAWGFNNANLTWGDFRRAAAAIRSLSNPGGSE